MIPTDQQIFALWDKYHLPPHKRAHVVLVDRVAQFLAGKVEKTEHVKIDKPLLHVAALTHDIDKAIPRRINEQHPDTAVRVIKEEGMEKVANLVRTHPLHAILDQSISPKSWEEKLLYLSDKMVKDTIITVDERFALWRAEHLPRKAMEQLDAAYPKVKALEQEICTAVGIDPKDIASLA